MKKALLNKRNINIVSAKLPAVVSPFSKKVTAATVIRCCEKTGKLPSVCKDYVIVFEDEKKPLFISASQYRYIMKSQDKTKAVHNVTYSRLCNALVKISGGKEWLDDYESLTARFFRSGSSNSVAPMAAGAE